MGKLHSTKVPFEQRYCVTCGKPLVKKTKEASTVYAKRKLHSGICHVTFLRKNRLGYFGNY